MEVRPAEHEVRARLADSRGGVRAGAADNRKHWCIPYPGNSLERCTCYSMKEVGRIPCTRLVEIGGGMMVEYDSIGTPLTETAYKILKQ